MEKTQNAAPVAIPDGWKLVPIEPTKEMCKAAVVYANGEDVYQTVTPAVLDIEESIYGETYRAMIEASPITGEQGKWVCTYETTASGDSGGGRWVGDKEYWSDAPATDTRADFEAHFQLTQRQAWQHKDGSYQFPEIQAKWGGYQAGVAKAAPSDLHAAIMNLACNVPGQWSLATQAAYKTGHRDARHAAAELVAAPVATAAPGAVPTDEEIAQAVENVVDTNGFDVQDEHQGELVLAVTTAVVRQLW